MIAQGRIANDAVRRTTSLLINVSTLLQESIGSVRQYEVQSASGAGIEAPVSGSLRLLRTDQSVLATAALTTSVTDVCGGCLQELEVPLSVQFDEEYWPASDPTFGVAIEPPPERAGFAATDGQIDLSEAMRQYVEMGRPMSPRCGSDCPGLATDEESETRLDDRWSALAALKLEIEQDRDD